MVKPIKHMTRRVNAHSGDDIVFRMDPMYKTGDEIEITAQSLASLFAKTVDYIKQITDNVMTFSLQCIDK